MNRPTFFIIDDGQFMDAASWELVYDLGSKGLSLAALPEFTTLPSNMQTYLSEIQASGSLKQLVVVVGTRPLPYYLDVVMPRVPGAYGRLRHDL